jgi:hypothetical protein
MAHLVSGNDKFPDLGYDDDYRFYLITRRDASDYRFGRTLGKRIRIRARNALRRVNGYLKNMIEAIANSKMRRMERELELRGIRFDRPDKVGWRAAPSRRSVREGQNISRSVRKF